jgi:hypothetical protein
MSASQRSRNTPSRREERLAVDRALGLSLLACVGGLLLRCWPLHRLAGLIFLGCVGLHLSQHEEWLRPLLTGESSARQPSEEEP